MTTKGENRIDRENFFGENALVKDARRFLIIWYLPFASIDFAEAQLHHVKRKKREKFPFRNDREKKGAADQTKNIRSGFYYSSSRKSIRLRKSKRRNKRRDSDDEMSNDIFSYSLVERLFHSVWHELVCLKIKKGRVWFSFSTTIRWTTSFDSYFSSVPHYSSQNERFSARQIIESGFHCVLSGGRDFSTLK